MKKFKPIFKVNNSKWHVYPWILDHFPPDYEEMHYVEPCVGDAAILLSKNRSSSEYINDPDFSIIQIFRCLRDEPKSFISKLKRTTYCEKTFLKFQDKTSFKDLLDRAISEFILRRMSRSGERLKFIESENSIQIWEEVLSELSKISHRLSNIHIFNKPVIDVIKAFDEENVLLYLNILEENSSKSTDDQIEIGTFLVNQFRGKAIINSPATALYKRLYGTWKCSKKKTPISNNCLWFNY